MAASRSAVLVAITRTPAAAKRPSAPQGRPCWRMSSRATWAQRGNWNVVQQEGAALGLAAARRRHGPPGPAGSSRPNSAWASSGSRMPAGDAHQRPGGAAAAAMQFPRNQLLSVPGSPQISTGASVGAAADEFRISAMALLAATSGSASAKLSPQPGRPAGGVAAASGAGPRRSRRCRARATAERERVARHRFGQVLDRSLRRLLIGLLGAGGIGQQDDPQQRLDRGGAADEFLAAAHRLLHAVTSTCTRCFSSRPEAFGVAAGDRHLDPILREAGGGKLADGGLAVNDQDV